MRGNHAPPPALAGRHVPARRVFMGQTFNGKLGAILGAIIAAAVIIFLLSGGEHVGKKTVDSDDDLPPVATGTSNPR
jgi:xanthine/uracil permease